MLSKYSTRALVKPAYCVLRNWHCHACFYLFVTEIAKKKSRQYSLQYKYGFLPPPTNEQLPMYLIREKIFSNEAIETFQTDWTFEEGTSWPDRQELNFFSQFLTNFKSSQHCQARFAVLHDKTLIVCVHHTTFHCWLSLKSHICLVKHSSCQQLERFWALSHHTI